jgi:hypothetical protein
MMRKLRLTCSHIFRSFKQTVRSWPRNILAWRKFWGAYHAYQRLAPAGQRAQWEFIYPCLHDDTSKTYIEPIYFYQDCWAFEKILQNRPPWHVDVGSHHKFVALLSKAVPVTMIDLRPLSLPLASLKFVQGSILSLPFGDRSVPSVSSICVIEHIGLGRYGDPLDPRGTEKALEELKRIVAPGGHLYLSLPLDDCNRVYFNAHRAFKEEYLLGLFPPFKLAESRYIYGCEFGEKHRTGFGTGCYDLTAP